MKKITILLAKYCVKHTANYRLEGWFLVILISLISITGFSQTQPAANLDQVRNGAANNITDPGSWVNGNLGPEQSHYFEGASVPYRVIMTQMPPATVVNLTIEYDVKHSGAHALDYLTHYDRIQPHDLAFGHEQEVIDPILGVPGFTAGDPADDSHLIPVPVGNNSPVAGMPADSYNLVNAGGGAYMSIWNGDITSIQNGAPANLAIDNSSQQVTITFTTGGALNGPKQTVVLAWGGHIASRVDWGYLNGLPRSAGGISGSPYHMRLISWNLNNLGQQDRSLKASAVIPPPECTLTGPEEKCEGETASFSVEATGAYQETYTWTLEDNTSGASITTNPTSGMDVTSVDVDTGTGSGSFVVKVVINSQYGSVVCEKTVNVIDNPDIETQDITLCESGSTGKASFTLSQGMKTSEGNISYYNSQANADAGGATGQLSSPYEAADGTMVYVRAENASDGSCYSTASFKLNVNDNPEVNTSPLEACESSFGSGNNIFTLEEGIDNDTEGTVVFYSDVNYANEIEDADINADGTQLVTGSTTIYVRSTLGDCASTGSFDITVLPLPPTPTPEVLPADCINDNSDPAGDPIFLGSVAFTYPEESGIGTNFYYSYKKTSETDYSDYEAYSGALDLAFGDYDFKFKLELDGCESEPLDVSIQQLPSDPLDMSLNPIQPDCATFLGGIQVTEIGIQNGGAVNIDDYLFSIFDNSGDPLDPPLPGYDQIEYPVGGFTGLAPGSYRVFALGKNGCNSGTAITDLEVPQCVTCGTAFGKDDEDASMCFSEVPNAETLIPNENRWGWTNLYSFNNGEGTDTNTLELWQGAAHCSGGTYVGTVTLVREGDQLSVEFESAENYYFGNIHLYVGGEPFMYKKKGKNYTHTVAPGQYNLNPSSLPSEYVTNFTIDGITLTEDYYVIAHVEACTSEYQNINEDNISSAVAGFFEPNRRFATMLPSINSGPKSATSTTSTSLVESSEPIFEVAPNPFTDQLNIRYLFDYESAIRIDVFDANGRLLKTYNTTKTSTTTVSKFNVDFKTRSGQLYIIRMTTNREIFSAKAISGK